MSTRIPFVKMHGLGNDFVIVRKTNIPDDISKEEFSKKILDRRLAIGADQLILYSLHITNSSTTKTASKHIVDMQIYNPDGSKGKACGNASRCITKLISDNEGINSFTLNVDNRLLPCKSIENGIYMVNMGIADFSINWMPAREQLFDLANKYNLGPKELICVDIGNPHLVIFSKLAKQDMKIIGRELQHSDLFPGGINVNFANINESKIYLKVYERGAGFTYACGSGACASFAGAYKLGRIAINNNGYGEVIFKLGSLKMQMEGDTVCMMGPAEYTFFGEYIYE